MTDAPFRTMVTLADSGEEVQFREYFVKLRHSRPVARIRFEHDDAEPTAAVMQAISGADVIVIAPSNPLVSVGPIRVLAGIDDLLAARRDRVVAVSPIVGGAALKGPADRMLTEARARVLGRGRGADLRPSPARWWSTPWMLRLADQVEAAGIGCVVAPRS